MKKILSISGICNSGKDTVFNLLSQRINCKRIALADSLRRELNSFIIDKFSIDLFNCSRAEKDLVRPILVEYARIKRKQTNGRYFINKVNDYIKSCFSTVVITDLRHAVYEKDELYWLKNELNGLLIHVSKYKEIDGKRVFAESPILDERENDPKLKAAANYCIEWPEVGAEDVNKLSCYVDDMMAKFQL